jgi:hypothetical protein
MLLAGSAPSASATKPTVLIDGDSITVLAAPAIQHVLDPSYNVKILATQGFRINQGLPALESSVRSHPYAVVENLGTNDALHGGVHPAWVSSWDKLIRITQDTPCVVLTTINPNADSLVGKPVATRINAEIMALAARYPKKFQVADWSGFLKRHVRNEATYLRPEFILIHPTQAGDLELATLDRDALAKCGK